MMMGTMRIALLACLLPCLSLTAANLDLSRANVVAGTADRNSALVLVEEVEKRTGIRLPVVASLQEGKISIALRQGVAGLAAEGYRLKASAGQVEIAGADARGVLYGVGAFLRRMDWKAGSLSIEAPLELKSAPVSRIRGHQLGYRAAANSWDAWTVAQFDQYIRELALFGANSIENIPFQDERTNPLMKVSRREMNREMSRICQRYGLDFWVWLPADFDLHDTAKRVEFLQRFEEMAGESVELSGVFVPGGDPGHNPPELVMPLLEDLAARLKLRHPKAKVWLSLQGFNAEKEEAVYRYIEQKRPVWLGGLVAGPSSPPAERSRRRLPREYALRLYPDLTHNKICQYQVPSWDQAFALTLGREAINPRPAEFARIHNRYAALSDGFISYSDGVHDDVNKNVFSALAWDPARSVREVLIDYARLHFSSALAPEIADGILALERNWRGPLVDNGGVEGTLLAWQKLEQKAPQLEANWRWQMNLLRATYDVFVRRRLISESGLEAAANAQLLAPGRNAGEAMAAARAILAQVSLRPESPELRARIVELCEKLFRSIGLQTSVGKYQASGTERGAVLDFVDYPLNNRWWLEDEFAKVSAMKTEAEKKQRLVAIAQWEKPGPGSFYDDVGNEGRSPHAEGDIEQEPGSFRATEPTFWWWDQGMSRARLSWQSTIWPRRMVYEGLAPGASYVVRTQGYGQNLLRADGKALKPLVEGKLMGEFYEFTVPAEALEDGRLELTWEVPKDEGALNWRQKSRLAEVWLLRKN